MDFYLTGALYLMLAILRSWNRSNGTALYSMMLTWFRWMIEICTIAQEKTRDTWQLLSINGASGEFETNIFDRLFNHLVEILFKATVWYNFRGCGCLYTTTIWNSEWIVQLILGLGRRRWRLVQPVWQTFTILYCDWQKNSDLVIFFRLAERISNAGFVAERYSIDLAKYIALVHEAAPKNPDRYSLTFDTSEQLWIRTFYDEFALQFGGCGKRKDTFCNWWTQFDKISYSRNDWKANVHANNGSIHSRRGKLQCVLYSFNNYIIFDCSWGKIRNKFLTLKHWGETRKSYISICWNG